MDSSIADLWGASSRAAGFELKTTTWRNGHGGQSKIGKSWSDEQWLNVYLLGKGRKLEDVKCLVEGGRALVDVDHHADPSRTTEEELQEVGKLGLPEGNVVLDPVETGDCYRTSDVTW